MCKIHFQFLNLEVGRDRFYKLLCSVCQRATEWERRRERNHNLISEFYISIINFHRLRAKSMKTRLRMARPREFSRQFVLKFHSKIIFLKHHFRLFCKHEWIFFCFTAKTTVGSFSGVRGGLLASCSPFLPLSPLNERTSQLILYF